MLDARRIGDVAAYATHPQSKAPQIFDGDGQRVCLDVGEHHLHTCLREGPAERKSNTACPARHECRLADKVPHGAPL